MNVARAASKKLDYYSKKSAGFEYATHAVLAEFCYQMDHAEPVSNEDGIGIHPPHSDRDIFDGLINNVELTIKLLNAGAIVGSMNALPSFGSWDGSYGPTFDQGWPPSEDTLNTESEHSFDIFDDDDIFSVQTESTILSTFHGVCIDTGAQRSVIGNPQAMAYAEFMGIECEAGPSEGRRVYKFGSRRHVGLGYMSIRIPIDYQHFVEAAVEFVDVDVPFLLGLEFHDKHKINIDVAGNMFTSLNGDWELPLTQKRGHLYL